MNNIQVLVSVELQSDPPDPAVPRNIFRLCISKDSSLGPTLSLLFLLLVQSPENKWANAGWKYLYVQYAGQIYHCLSFFTTENIIQICYFLQIVSSIKTPAFLDVTILYSKARPVATLWLK